MFKLTKCLFLSALTPMHVGSGNEFGIVDMPIQREGHTDFPKIEASSLKGCIKEAFESNETKTWAEENKINYTKMVSFAFGPETDAEGDFASAVAVSDARLLFFPVKSVKGVFAWITCPLVLNRFYREMKMAGIEINKKIAKARIVTKESALLLKSKNGIMLEEFPIDVLEDDDLNKFVTEVQTYLPENELINQLFHNHVAVVSDDDFKDFVNLSTEVITRTRIDNHSGIVVNGALFNEEYLPGESILYSLMMISPLFFDKKNEDIVNIVPDQPNFIDRFIYEKIPKIMQIGGNATLGKGLISIKISPNPKTIPVIKEEV